MQFFLSDLIGFGLATLLAVPMMIMPGFGLMVLIRRGGAGVAAWTADTEQMVVAVWALLLGLASLPICDALLTRFIGLEGAIALRFMLAIIGCAAFLGALRRIAGMAWIAFVGWWLVVCLANVDIGSKSALNQSLLIIDVVKHSAIISMIEAHGLPLHDPFFARPEAAGYYYYFYVVCAALVRLGGWSVDGRMAFAAAAFWTGVSFPLLLWMMIRQAGWVREGGSERTLALCGGLCLVLGMDLIPMLARWAMLGQVEAQIDWWNDEISFALPSLLWVPHHMAAVIATFLALMLIVDADGGFIRNRWVRFITAAFILASAFGLSLWVTLGAAAVIALWVAVEIVAHRRPPVMPLAGCAALALMLSSIQIADLLHGRTTDAAVLGVWVRPFAYLDFGSPWISLLLLPVGYILDFGFFALGAAAFFNLHPADSWRDQPVARMLIVAAVAGLLLNAFVRSTIINNDFGWRVIWFTQLPLMIWTIVALQDDRLGWMGRPAARIALALGLLASLWLLPAYRLLRPPVARTSFPYVNTQPTIDHDLRDAYGWANTHLSSDAILQHNPASQERVFDFGLYSRHRVAVADAKATLFGASHVAVADRIARLRPVFNGTLTEAQRDRAARSLGIDYLVLTADDPAWSHRGHSCVYYNDKVCIARTGGQ